MRKFSVALVTILLVMVMGVSNLFGCGLVTTNNAKNLSQVVATVKISNDAPEDIIYKRDVINAYINSYQYQGSELTSDVLDSILSNLVNNRVLVQYVLSYFAEEKGVTENKYDVVQYLSDEDKLDAEYLAYKDMDEMIDSYEEHNHNEDKYQDTFNGTVRATPTGASSVKELTDDEKKEFIDEFKTSKFDIATRRNAFVKAINSLKENDLLGDNYKNDDITTTLYYEKVLKSYYEQKIVEDYTDVIMSEARATITYENVQQEYARIYNAQKEMTTTEYNSLVDSVSASAPILYGKEGYGLVYHVLLKVDDQMDAKVKEIEEENKQDLSKIPQLRAELFEGITASDQRATWITSGYDFDGTNFTGDYTLCKDNGIPFKGEVTLLNGADKESKDYKAEYRVDDTDKINLDDFMDLVNDYLYNGTATTQDDRKQSGLATYTATQVNDNFTQRVKELIFAFSQDDSDTALNTYKGYAIKAEGNSYMDEFTDAGKELITKDQKTFMLVATNYGYHVMFFSENLSDYDYPTLEEYLNKEFKMSENIESWKEELALMLKDWDEYENTNNYLYILHNNLASNIATTAFNNKEQSIINDYVNNKNCVKTYPEVYSDLIKE